MMRWARFAFAHLRLLKRMTDQQTRYPDISDILARKAAGRIHNASLSFATKLAILDALKERASLFIQARKIREAKQAALNQEAACVERSDLDLRIPPTKNSADRRRPRA
jgi:hypothetical protein